MVLFPRKGDRLRAHSLYFQAVRVAAKGIGVVSGMAPSRISATEVAIASGTWSDGSTLSSYGGGSITTIPAASAGMHRYDIIVLDSATGNISRIAGSENVPTIVSDFLENIQPLPPELANDGQILISVICVTSSGIPANNFGHYATAGIANLIINVPGPKLGTADIVTTVGSPGLDSKVPSEQATREGLDAKISTADIVTTVGSPGSDSKVPSEQGVREAFDVVISGATANTDEVTGANDYLLIHDNSAGGLRKITPNTLSKRKESIILTAQGMWPRSSTGCLEVAKVQASSNRQSFFRLGFENTVKEYANIAFALPDRYDGGTITAVFYWMQDGTLTGGVRWGIQGRAYGDAETIDQAWGTAQEVTDNGTSTAKQVLTSAATPAMTLAGTPAGGELAMLQIYRNPIDPADTLEATVYLLGIKIEYGVNAWSD